MSVSLRSVFSMSSQLRTQEFLSRLPIEARDCYLGVREYELNPARHNARNGFYERDFVTHLDTLRRRLARHPRFFPSD